MNPSFVLPAENNRIKPTDIKRGYLRITVDFKHFFQNQVKSF